MDLEMVYITMRELQLRDAEHERALRFEAERRLHDMTVESKNTHSRLLNLQREFKKMEEIVTNMMQYKTKIDQLKQEKSSLSVTYESNLSKYRSHIGNLERENMMLMNDIRRYENQMDGKTDDRSKLLLERLKILEAENSALVLENEQQRQQYEKCLDEIANQVVQALLAQKTLREECVKLQKRVTDLESQNSELSLMYHQKLKDSGIKAIGSIQNTSTFTNASRGVPNEAVVTSTTQCQVSAAISFTQSMQLSPMSQYILQNTVAQKCLQQLQPESIGSVQDVCSDSSYQGNTVQHHLTIPSAWGDDQSWQRSRSASSPSNISTQHSVTNRCNQKTKIETEFPATPSSPKVKHISVTERAKAQRSASTSSLPVHSKLPSTKTPVSKSPISQTSRSVSNVAGHGNNSRRNSESKSVKCKSQPDHIDKVNISNTKVTSRAVKVHTNILTESEQIKMCSNNAVTSIPVKKASKSQQSIPQTCHSATQSKIPMKSVLKSEHHLHTSARKSPVSVSNTILTVNVPNSQDLASSYQGKVNIGVTGTMSSPITKSMVRSDVQGTVHNTPSAPILPKAQYFYDYSDEDSDFNRPISGEFRASSAGSLNEILDGDDTDTLLDEEITAETFSFFDPPSFIKSSNAKDMNKVSETDLDKHQHKKVIKSSSLGSKPDIIKDTMNSEMKMHSRSPHMGRRKLSLSYQNKKVKGQGQRPSSLILTREKQNLYDCSSSLSSTDSDENWSPQMERKAHPRHKGNRKSSSSSNRSSYHSSVSDKLSHRSSQELTPVAMETKQFVSNEVQLSKNSETLQHSNENITNMKESMESNNSLNRKKGPPPPVPRKPLSGKKSPGIRMGIQSPGFRQNKQSQYSCVGKDAIADPVLILKPHEFKSDLTKSSQETLQKSHISTAEIKITSSVSKKDVCDELTNKTSLHISNPTNQKYVSSDSSFEGKNLDKVERSGSKDDGYSTMSSDIQPEALERFSDASLSKTEALFTDIGRNEGLSAPVSPKTLSSKTICKTSPETVSSDLDSILETTTADDDMKTSSSLSSLTCLKSPNSPKANLSEERAVRFGSLGRVKAMRMLFEAENLNSDVKSSKFPLRKSPSVDSSLSSKKSNLDVHKIKRHSLGDDFKLSPVSTTEETDTQTVKVSDKIKDLLEPTNIEKTKATEERKKFEPQQRATLTPSIPEKPPSFQPLHLSEENFLSDIPEERDEGDMSTHSSANHLEVSLRNSQQMSRRLEVLNLLRIQHKKSFWCSLHGLSRISLAADKVQDLNSKSDKGFRPVDNMRRPLERSRSLDDVYRDINYRLTHKILPRLSRNQGAPAIDELLVEEQVQSIMKTQILQQLSSINVSDEDLQHLSFSKLLENGKLKDLKYSKFPNGPSSHISNFHGKGFVGQPTSLFSKEMDSFSSWEDKSTRRVRQSSISSSEGSINQDVDAHFRSDYYSLCTVDSSKASSVDGDNSDQLQHTCRDDRNSCSRCIQDKNTEEFEEISRQLANLSKTVCALHQSLSSLNSHDSETESNEDRSHDFVAPPGDFKDIDGYQWEEDEFYLTPCGGEIIMGNSPFSPTGACADWVNEYVDDTSCNDEFEFYGNLPEGSENGMYDFKKLCDSITEGGDFENMASSGTGETTAVLENAQTDDVNGNKMQSNNQEDKKADQNSDVLDPKLRAAMLDSMVHLSCASMDSLDDNIGVDHVMCSRLIGRGENAKGPVRSAVPRPTVDLSKFYSRFGQSEQEAVAAFDFLNDISTSPDTSQQEIEPQINQSQPSLQTTQGKPKAESKMKTDKKKVGLTKEKTLNQSKERLMYQARDKLFSHSKDKSVNQNKEKNTNNSKEKTSSQLKEKHTHPKKLYSSQEQAKSVGQSVENDNQSKIPDVKKQIQGLDNSDTSKKGSQGLVSSISRFVYGNKGSSNMSNAKTPKVKTKEEKTTLSKLPRKFIPGKEKVPRSKVESKIPKPSKN